jgi:hypothetical protein
MAGLNSEPGAGSQVKRISRYPGVQPFGDDEIQRRLFRGRDKEKYELLQLVLAERLVLLFARSGIGKSSLINAGLLAPLRDQGYFPMVVRVSGSSGSPLDCLYDGIRAMAEKTAEHGQIEYEPSESEWNKASLWHFFKTFELWKNDRLLSPVLVIDQFEELFTLHAAKQRKQFINELADLVRGTRPRVELDNLGPKLSDAPPEVKVVLTLREDFYANLEELRDRIPSIYKAPFRLKPLSRGQAGRAIVEPAKLEGEHFATPPFSWSDEALEKVLDFLSERRLGEGKTTIGKEVEPFQLQLICQHVEQTVRERNLEIVTPEDLGGADALKAILSSFYEETLRKICHRFPQERGLREKLERLCEYGFITAKGRRLLREESTIKHDDGVAPEILREMVELRLLRKEPRVGDNYYELTHDTLIEPIQLSRQAREERKAQEARQARQAEKRKMRNRLMAVGVAAMVVLIFSGAFTLWQRAETQQATRMAEQKTQQALKAKNRAVEAKQRAVVKLQKSVEVAVKAKLEAGEEGAKRLVAVAETRLSEFERQAVVAREKLANAKQLAVEAEGQKYEEEAKQLVTDAEVEFQKAMQKVKIAQKTVYQAKTKVTLAEAKREVIKVKLAAPESDGRGEDKLAEQQVVDAEMVLAYTERQTEILEKRLTGTASRGVQPLGVTVEKSALEEKTVLKARAKVDLAELELREADSEISDVVLAKQYREYLNSSGNGLGADVTRKIENKIRKLEQASTTFAELKRNDEDPNVSVCEKFDGWTAYQPQRPLGPDAEYRDLRLAELNALLQDSAIVTTQKNFITSKGKADLKLNDTFTVGKDRVYLHAWINAPGRETVTFLFGQKWKKDYKVEKNPLRGVHMGFRLSDARSTDALGEGEHELLLYNSNNKLICRRKIKVIAASQ